jgi:uncharacterized protein DUF4384
MSRRWLATWAALGLLALGPAAAGAREMGVEVWTDRGDDAVYQPGQTMEIRARSSQDAYLLVYEIDAEGYVRQLYPYRGSTGLVEGRQTYRVPPERSNVDLVVEGPVGQCYVVAIAAREPFRDMPWYLRPYDMQAENVGYEGMRDDEEGITAEGRIVGDPFVAMERIRRRVLEDPEDASSFSTSYATYYVHNQVRHPRYLCYDCHRPGRWAWWPGFDPYYTTCSVFDFRINWGWGWGPGYWFGYQPYYYYVVRHDCPPRYLYYRGHYSSWDGWRRWNAMWGDHLIRYKSNPPPGYVPPSRYPDRGTWRSPKSAPPGFIVGDVPRGRTGMSGPRVIGRNQEARPRDLDPGRGRDVVRRPLGDGQRAEPMPARGSLRERDGGRRPVRGPDFDGGFEGGPKGRDGLRPRERDLRPDDGVREPAPRDLPRGDRTPRRETREAPAPRFEPPRGDWTPRRETREAPAPRYEKSREAPAPRYEKPRDERPADKPRDVQRSDPPREGRSRERGGRYKG